MLLRFITGLGLGGLPPNCIALDAEFAPKRVRATVIVVMYLGVTVGSMLPAAVTAAMGQTYRWQTLFIIGGIVPLAAAVILFFGLPESIKFLVLHKKSRAQIARLVASIQPGISLAPDAEFVISEESGKPSKLMVTSLFSGGLAWITSLVWLLYVVNLMANFFLHNWMPILFRDDGLTIRQMGISTAMYDVGGIFGALIASRLLDKRGIKTLVAFFALGVPLVAAIGTPGMTVLLLGATVFMTGFCIVGIQLALNATVGIIYPTAIRANGAGWASSIGRFGAILGPLLGGWLIAMHASVQQLFLAPAVPMAVGVVAAFVLMRFCVARFRGDRLGETAAPRPSFDIASQRSAPALRKQDPMADIDPITLSTVWHAFQTLVREMRHMVTRTSQSYLMSQLKDVSVGLWLADGSTVAMPQGLLCQFMGTKFAIEAVKDQFGDDLHPGDVILTNDPYKGTNVHLPDWGFFRPIFYQGELLFFMLVRGHQMDTGGSFPGGYFPNAYDIHAEGLCIPPIKVFDKDQERKMCWGSSSTTSAGPRRVRVDNYAMVATTRSPNDRVTRCSTGTARTRSWPASARCWIASSVRCVARSPPSPTAPSRARRRRTTTAPCSTSRCTVRFDITVKGDELIARLLAQRRASARASSIAPSPRPTPSPSAR